VADLILTTYLCHEMLTIKTMSFDDLNQTSRQSYRSSDDARRRSFTCEGGIAMLLGCQDHQICGKASRNILPTYASIQLDFLSGA
jgi:hypothetical protein